MNTKINTTTSNSYTPIVDASFPSERDLKLSAELNELLVANNIFPTPEESQKKELVLGKLNGLVLDWIKEISLSRGFNEDIIEDIGGKLLSFGSYRLGVDGPGADIDTVCIVPMHVTKEDFFDKFKEKLADTPSVERLIVPSLFLNS